MFFVRLERPHSSRGNSFQFFVLKYLFPFNFCFQLWETGSFKTPSMHINQNCILFPHGESISIITCPWSTCTYTAPKPPKLTFCTWTRFFLNVLASRGISISISSAYSIAYYIVSALPHFVIYNLVHELISIQSRSCLSELFVTLKHIISLLSFLSSL